MVNKNSLNFSEEKKIKFLKIKSLNKSGYLNTFETP